MSHYPVPPTRRGPSNATIWLILIIAIPGSIIVACGAPVLLGAILRLLGL